jgi:hypothetical protein
MQKRIFLVLWLCLLTSASNSFATAGLLGPGTASPTPFPGNTVVNVSPGSGTISAAVNAHGGNTTYMLQNGTFIENNISVNANHVQFIGSGAPNVRIQASGPGAGIFNGGGGTDFVTVWGMTIDLAVGNGSAIGGNFSDLLFQNVHVQNYSSIVQGQEDFPVYLFATGYSPNNLTVDSCQFTPASSGNRDGTSVIATGEFRPDGGNYTNITLSNNLFDTPTDHGTSYYHCVGSAQHVTGNVFVAPNFTNGMFWYEEAGSWNGNPAFQSNASNTSTLTGNTVTLAPNWNFAGVVAHANGNNDNLVIAGNTINGNSSSGSVINVQPQACPTSGFAIKSLILQNDAIQAGINLVSQACANGSPWITSPNNGITGVPSLTASAPNVGLTTATLNGAIVSNGNQTVTSDGFDWGTTTSYGNSAPAPSVQSGSFTATLTGLTSGMAYHYRAKAVNSSGTGLSGDSAFTSSATPTPTPTPASNVFIGTTTVRATDDYGNAGLLLAQKATLSQPDNIQSLSFYVTSAVGKLRLGIYSDVSGSPGTLLASTPEMTPAVGWNTASVTPVALQPGTYWLAYTPSDNGLHFRVDQTSGTIKAVNRAYGALPTVFGSGSTQTANWSLYGTLSSSASTTPIVVYGSNYNAGGQGVGYQDSVGANAGAARSDGVDLKATSDSPTGTGYVLGWRTAGEWTKYTVSTGAGKYSLTARIESAVSTGAFHVSVDGVPMSKVAVPLTGPWDTASSWKTLNLGTVTLTGGSHTFQVSVDAAWFDLNFLTLTPM